MTHICENWEDEANKANARVVIFRFGVVLGNGGALNKMLIPFKLGLGGKIGDGKQPFSYIHVLDLARAYEFLIQKKELEGVFNLCTPYPVTNNQFTQILANILKRPAFLPLPAFVVKLIFGEGASVLTNGQNVYPKRLLDNGFKFNYEKVEDVLTDLLLK